MSIKSSADNWLADAGRLNDPKSLSYDTADYVPLRDTKDGERRRNTHHYLTVYPRPTVALEDVKAALAAQYPDKTFTSMWHGNALLIRRQS